MTIATCEDCGSTDDPCPCDVSDVANSLKVLAEPGSITLEELEAELGI